MAHPFAYCERLSDAFWAEPLNAVSNLVFAAAALIAYTVWRKRTPDDLPVVLLILVVALIAIGSFLFHTMPGPVTVLLDVVPIQLFVLGYFALALRRFIGLQQASVVVGLVGFFVFSATVTAIVPRSALSGSVSYLPALAALAVLGLFLMKQDMQTARALLAGAAIFALSLTMRTLDQPLCAHLPIGLHFLWHCLNGALLFLLLLTAIRQRSRNRSVKPVS